MRAFSEFPFSTYPMSYLGFEETQAHQITCIFDEGAEFTQCFLPHPHTLDFYPTYIMMEIVVIQFVSRQKTGIEN